MKRLTPTTRPGIARGGKGKRKYKPRRFTAGKVI